MRRISNPYRESSIFELNMMAVHEYRRSKFSYAEMMVLALPVIAIALLVCANFMPELSFFADCRNIEGGDLCSITLG